MCSINGFYNYSNSSFPEVKSDGKSDRVSSRHSLKQRASFFIKKKIAAFCQSTEDIKNFINNIVRDLTRSQKANRIHKAIEVLHKALQQGKEGALEFSRLPEKIQNFFFHAVWVADGKPEGDPEYGRHQVEQHTPRLFLNMQDDEGRNILQQLTDHYRACDKKAMEGIPVPRHMLKNASKILRERPFDITANRLEKKDSADVLAKPVKAVMVAAESMPVLKQGGLAEAVHGIAEGLIGQNQDSKVRLIMPKYDILSNKIALREKPSLVIANPANGGKINKVFKGKIGAVKYYFIEDAPGENFYRIGKNQAGNTGTIYGPNDEAVKERFAEFSSAAAELSQKFQEKGKADVVHLHDWHAAPVATLMKRRHEGKAPPIVFTFHNNNFAAQGVTHGSLPSRIGIFQPEMNALVQGIYDADEVTTVSETFAKEAQTPHLGFRIDHVVRDAVRRDKLTGIVNGSNPAAWNPQTDEQLKQWRDPLTGQSIDLTYGPNDDIVAKKALIKQQLQKWLQRNQPNVRIDLSRPLVTYVGRYDSSQKGIDHLAPAMRSAIASGGQFIAMGSQEDPRASALLDNLQAEAGVNGGGWIIRDHKGPDNRFIVQQGSQGHQGVGSLVRAASDFVLVPSEFEPCGLVQFEGWLFGALTIGTKTGGIADTVQTEGPHFNGFLFDRKQSWHSEEQKSAVGESVASALDFWKKQSPEQKQQLMKRVMEEAKSTGWTDRDLSGLSPIEKYRYVYSAANQRATQSAEDRIKKINAGLLRSA